MNLHPAATDRSDDVDPATRGLLLTMALAAIGSACWGGLLQAALPWPVPPLHARCLAALQAAAALTWLRAAFEKDFAAVRIPLVLALAGPLVAGLQVLVHWPHLAPAGACGWGWLVLQAGCAVGAGVRLARDGTLQAPAERMDGPLAASAVVALVACAGLALRPATVAAAWPWPLPLAAAALYASAFGSWVLPLAMLARERRHGARRWALWGLCAPGPLVALASWLHRSEFHHPAAALAWSALFLAWSALAGWRLQPRGRRRLSEWLRRVRPSAR